MAFDQSTRNRLQKFVNDARNLLTEEFTRQLQATYGLDPKAGSVAAVDSLTHLDNRQRQTANVLRDTLAHYLATTHGKGEKDRTKQALTRIVREQAFTVLNRLAALRMAEARGFLLETIARGYNAKGFQLYKQLAGSSLGETGQAYRNYLYSVFDEFSLDLAVLFDRHSAQGRLFPRESALLELLDLINHHGIEPLWAEDETIGWIYQYFNSQEERKKMRAESQAPRNSRELAVRNQFFTPRYVVEFLTDNTLGRIWYEMTQGNTGLVESCRYLVRRPTELFLKPGELAPKQEESAGKTETLSQEELLKQPVYIQHRAIKDPRCIRMLDPACGSMHFGLYAFDLYERIYEEAWQLEAELGAEAFVREVDLKPLHQTYDSFEDYRAEIPRLIIEHNIHGVDIDPRAVQIAGLSLWQRAQRAWQQQGIKPQQRPVVRKSNIVCAEPMPGEKSLLQEFSSSLNPPVLGQLVEAIFDKMELAGEAGTLLKIEEEIQSSIHEARDQWLARSGSNSVSDMFQAELDQATPQKKLGFDLSGVDDESFWDGAEQLILDALSNYADKAESNADQKRLFAEDAAKGFAFIDLCRKRFDVVLMNPPFGSPTKCVFKYAEDIYEDAYVDIYSSFVNRGFSFLAGGMLGAITPRTFLASSRLENWRRTEVNNSILILIDYGIGVMDDAMVRSCAYILSKADKNDDLIPVVDARRSNSKDEDTLNCWSDFSNSKRFIFKRHFIETIPGKKFLYFLGEKVHEIIKSSTSFEPKIGTVRKGLTTFDDFRFVKLRWEIPIENIGVGKFEHYAKGGEYKNYATNIHLVINRKKNAGELAAVNMMKNGQVAQSRQGSTYYYRRGCQYTTRSKGFSTRAIPDGCVMSSNAPLILSESKIDTRYLLAWSNSRFIKSLVEMQSMADDFVPGSIKSLPWRYPEYGQEREVAGLAEKVWGVYNDLYMMDETYPYFNLRVQDLVSDSIQKAYEVYRERVEHARGEIVDLQKSITTIVDKVYDVDSEQLGEEVLDRDCVEEFTYTISDLDIFLKKLISYFVGVQFGRYVKSHELEKHNISIFSELPSACPIYNTDTSSTKAIEDGEALAKSVSQEIRQSFKEEVHYKETIGTDIESLFIESCQYFKDHYIEYSASQKYAPIYWPLQTPSGSYTLWVYYHSIKEQTPYACVNDFVQPKLEKIEQSLNTLREKSARSRQEDNDLEKLSDLGSELRDFRDELLRLAKFWKPNLNDGVQITAAPLWKLFQHKAWQKKLKETWEKLEKGDYDWAHLACSIWPERVLRKCHQDRSLAIAHDVEDTFWHEVEVPVMRGKKATGETKLEWQPKELTDYELDALIQAKIKEKRA
jgi:hypothetical protein